MYKLIVKLTNPPSPLEETLFDGEKILELYVESLSDPEEILKKLEPEIVKIRGTKKSHFM